MANAGVQVHLDTSSRGVCVSEMTFAMYIPTQYVPVGQSARIGRLRVWGDPAPVVEVEVVSVHDGSGEEEAAPTHSASPASAAASAESNSATVTTASPVAESADSVSEDASSSPHAQVLAEMVELGFDKDLSRLALEASNGDLAGAIDILIQNQ